MDGLIVLLVILGLVSSIGKKAKAKQQQQRQRARQAGYDEISAVPPPLMRKAAAKAAQAPGLPEAEAAAPAKPRIPYTKEDWAKLIDKAESAAPKAAPSADAGSMQHTPTEGLHVAAAPAQRLRPAEQHSEGESHREHAAHKQRIAEEEARLHREREELRELRNVNLKKLRSAVVMSEVLGKPVALRGRR